MRIKQAQIDIEKSKIEIQNRETNIKEEASQREADETARKLTQLKEQKAEVAKCEARTSSLILKAQQNAGCS